MFCLRKGPGRVGWTVLYDNRCTSYPIPLLLVIYKDGKAQQRLNKSGQMIYDGGSGLLASKWPSAQEPW